jgi:hypothetical protein
MRSNIINCASDLMTDFLYYDRKESEYVPMYAIEDAIINGEITIDDLVDVFRKDIQSAVDERRNG